MINLATTVGLGFLTNLIYDVVKHLSIQFSINKKSSDKHLREIVESELTKSLPEDLKPLLESSTFVEYFSSAQFIDVINTYTEYKLIYNCTNIKHVKVSQFIEKAGIITNHDIINYISDNIYNLYIDHQVVSIPTTNDIEKTVQFVINLLEKIAVETLSPETSTLLYFFNTRIDQHHKEIIDALKRLQNKIEDIEEKRLTIKNKGYDDIKIKYYNILKDKNSDAHIYLLDKFPFEKFYVPPILQKATNERDRINMISTAYYKGYMIDWNDIFNKDNIIYLTGGAGYGKSLFTKKIINDYKDLNIFHSDEYIVIYGELKSFFPNGSNVSISVIDFLKESIKSSTLMDVSTDFIEYYLNSGRCIILLDALDEVEKSKRAPLHESVVAFFKNQNPNNKICITSRDRGFIPERNVEVFKICPLNEDQIEKYVDKIIALGKFEKSDKETFMKQTQILVQKGFLNSFLVLSLLINIYKAERELPENKLDLYQKCFEYIANRREKDKTQEDFEWRIISPIMKDNTFIELSRMGMPNNSNIDRTDIKDHLLKIYKTKYISEAETENAIDEFLKFCSDRTELFVPTSEDKYKFFHRSFFEYFYSSYIFLRCNNEHEILSEFLNFDVDSEVFELTVAMLKQKSEIKYQELVDLLFAKSYEEIEGGLADASVFNILILSMQVVDDALYKKKFLDILIKNKELILSRLIVTHNLRLVSSIFSGDEDAYKKLSNAYKDECLMNIFNSCESLFRMADDYDKNHNLKFFETIFQRKKSLSTRASFVYDNYNADNSFFMSIFAKVENCIDIILSTTDDTILSIYKKYSPRNYKKKTSATRDAITKFSALSKDFQIKISELIISNDFSVDYSKAYKKKQ